MSEQKWISIHKALPRDGDYIQGKSATGKWVEVWDSDEPLGQMTEWRPLTKIESKVEQVRGWVDNRVEGREHV